jgi:hypothetical protein
MGPAVNLLIETIGRSDIGRPKCFYAGRDLDGFLRDLRSFFRYLTSL